MAKKKESPITPVASAIEPATLAELKKPTDAQIALAVTNDPALSQSEFKLGDKTYRYVHLSYDYYIEFMFKIKPLLAAVVGTIATKSKATVKLPGIELADTSSSVINFCSADIPDMVRIIINNSLEAEGRDTDKVTAAEIKKIRGITPMSLTEIVMGQVGFNNMIAEFGSFFVQSVPLLKAMGILTQPQAK